MVSSGSGVPPAVFSNIGDTGKYAVYTESIVGCRLTFAWQQPLADVMKRVSWFLGAVHSPVVGVVKTALQ